MDEEIKTANPLGYQKISKLLRSLAIPAIIANLVNALYNVVDRIFIGQGIGYLGNAATNIAFPITTICLALGFKGQYALKSHGQENIQNILIKLQKTLRPLRGYDYQRKSKTHLYERDYTVKKPLSLSRLFLGTLLIFSLIYFLYSMYLNSYSTEIINNINDIMHKS